MPREQVADVGGCEQIAKLVLISGGSRDYLDPSPAQFHDKLARAGTRLERWQILLREDGFLATDDALADFAVLFDVDRSGEKSIASHADECSDALDRLFEAGFAHGFSECAGVRMIAVHERAIDIEDHSDWSRLLLRLLHLLADRLPARLRLTRADGIITLSDAFVYRCSMPSHNRCY